MNDSVFRRLEQLARQAADEPAIEVDVADRVFRTLKQRHYGALSERVAVTFFVGTLAAAAMSLAVVLLSSGSELPVEFIQPFVSIVP